MPSNVIEEEADYDCLENKCKHHHHNHKCEIFKMDCNKPQKAARPQSQENTSKRYFVWLNNILGK